MNDKIWVVVKGCYSDWQIQGYCQTEAEAEKICEIANRKGREAAICWEDLYYIGISPFSKATDEVHPYKRYHVLVYMLESKTAQFYAEVRWTVTFAKERPAPEIYEDGYSAACIDVYVDIEDDEEKAEKIAQDVWYQRMAEKEGVN